MLLHPRSAPVLLAAGLSLALAGPAAANSTVETFDTDPVLGPPASPGTLQEGVWHVDRFAPAIFESIDDPTGQPGVTGGRVLHHGIRAADEQSNAFRNTQGRALRTPYNGVGDTFSVDLFVPSDWQAFDDQRIAGLWGRTRDADGDVSGFPIIEFGLGNFRVFTQDTGSGDAGFVELGLQSDFAYDQWYTLETTLTATSFEFSVFRADGSSSEVLSYSDPTTFDSVTVENIFLQGINFGQDVDIYWDNLVTAVPTPAAAGAGLVLLGGLGALRTRRSAGRE